MLVDKWMKRPVHTVKPLDSIRHAREIMENHRVNQVPVVVDGQLVGIVTDRDLRDAFPSVFDAPGRPRARRAAPVADPDEIRVEMVMTPHVITVGPKETVAEVARIMRRERIGAIPVVEGKRLVGMITRSDLLDALVALSEQVRP